MYMLYVIATVYHDSQRVIKSQFQSFSSLLFNGKTLLFYIFYTLSIYAEVKFFIRISWQQHVGIGFFLSTLEVWNAAHNIS